MIDANDERIDSNPYAYPYFHSDGSGPLLYRLILEFQDLRDQQLQQSQTHHENQGSTINVGDTTAKASADLLRRVRSRCIVKPIEAAWADSCGDCALHRLCQAARFGPLSTTSSATETSWEEMTVIIAKSLVQAQPKIASLQNSWKETALHQYAAHCGIMGVADGSDSGEGSDDGSDDFSPDTSMGNWEIAESSFEILQILLHAFPDAARTRNYLLSTPLHEACSLSQGPEDLMRRFVLDLSLDLSTADIIARNRRLEWMRRRQRAVIRLLIRACPEALFGCDKVGRTPLLRATESDRCGGDVVATLIDATETICRDKLNLDTSETRNVVKCLANGEIAETDVTSELARYGEFLSSGLVTQQPDRVDEKDVRRAVLCLANGKVNGNVRNRRSPLEHLMNEWNWTPRKLPLAGSTTGIMAGETARDSVTPSRTTVSSLVTSSLRKGSDPRDITRQLGPLWEKTMIILRAAYFGSIEDSAEGKWKVLHAAVAFSFPVPFIDLLIRLNPDEINERDENGRTPLLSACCQRDFGRSQGSNPCDLIDLLICSKQGSCRIVDPNGRLPLHVAIEAHQPYSVLQSLLAAEPRSLMARDPLTGLYPCMLSAASDSTGKSRSSGRADELESMTITFELLRADPSACALRALCRG